MTAARGVRRPGTRGSIKALLPALFLASLLAGSAVGGAAGGARPDAIRSLSQAPSNCTAGLTLTLTPASGPIPLLVNFTLTEANASAGPVAWGFGDGSGWNSSARTVTTVLHVYYAPGRVVANVSVAEASGTGLCQATVVATAPPLQLTIRGSPVGGPAPLTVDFTANVTGGTGTYRSLTWAFSDGRNGSGFAVAVTFSAAGTVGVTATVVDSAGASAVAETNVSVTPGPTPPVTGAGGASTPLPEIAGGLFVLLLAVVAIVAIVWFFRSRPTSSDPAIASSFETAPEDPAPPGSSTTATTWTGTAGPDRPPPITRRSRPRPSSGPALTLSQQILLQLAALGPIDWHEVTPRGYTQLGLAEQLGARQGFVSNVLVRMVAAGLVAHELRHVPGFSRRVKVYRLTPIGQSMARQLRSAPVDPAATAPSGSGARPTTSSSRSDG